MSSQLQHPCNHCRIHQYADSMTFILVPTVRDCNQRRALKKSFGAQLLGMFCNLKFEKSFPKTAGFEGAEIIPRHNYSNCDCPYIISHPLTIRTIRYHYLSRNAKSRSSSPNFQSSSMPYSTQSAPGSEVGPDLQEG
jgi:hypothetical protein